MTRKESPHSENCVYFGGVFHNSVYAYRNSALILGLPTLLATAAAYLHCEWLPCRKDKINLPGVKKITAASGGTYLPDKHRFGCHYYRIRLKKAPVLK